MECNAESISAPKPGSSPLPPPPPTPPPPRTVDEELELLMKQRGMSMNFVSGVAMCRRWNVNLSTGVFSISVLI